MNARLKVLHEKANVKTVKLLPTTVIGRSTECDLKISASEVSRVHCRITVQDDAVFIEDLGSANGTFVNDEMLKPRQRVAIDPGAKITIGPAEFVVDYVAPTSNTVIVRRTDKDGKSAPSPSQSDAESESRELVFSSIPDTTEVSSAEATLVTDSKENPFTTAKVNELGARHALRDSERHGHRSSDAVPAAAPPAKNQVQVSDAIRVVSKNEVVETSKPAVTAPKPAVPVAKTAVAVPVASPKAKAVAVSTSIVSPAKAIPAEARDTAPILPAREIGPVRVDAPAPSAGPQLMFVDSATVAQEGTESQLVSEEATQFNFEQDSEPRRATKSATSQGKSGGLKSLLSVFGFKPTTTTHGSNATPPAPNEPTGLVGVETPSDETAGAAAAPPIAAESTLSFGAAEQATDAHGETTEEPPAADDFQNFLRQF